MKPDQFVLGKKGAQFFNTEADKPLEQITKGGNASAFADAFR